MAAPRGRTVRTRIPAAMQTRSFSYGAAAAAARLARVVTGAAVDTVTTAFPVRPTSCLSSILRGPPWKGVGETSVASRLDDRQLLSAAGCYCIAGLSWYKEKTSERGDHNGLAAHLTEPSLINTQLLCTRINLQWARGVLMRDGGARAQAITWLHMSVASAARLTATEKIQLNTQSNVENWMLSKEAGAS